MQQDQAIDAPRAHEVFEDAHDRRLHALLTSDAAAAVVTLGDGPSTR